MKILFLSYYFEPDLCAGSFRNTALFKELLSHLTETDFVHVITTQPNRYQSYKGSGKGVEDVEFGSNYKINRINVPKHSGSFFSLIKSFNAFYNASLKLTKNKDYDLVYASSSRLFTAFLGKRIASKKKIPLYLDIRDIFVDTIKDLYKHRKIFQKPLIFCLKPIEKYTFSKASHINLVSEGFKEYFNQYKYPTYSFFTNGIDDIFLNIPIQLSVPSNPSDKTVIVYTGNIGSGQGLEKIIPKAAKGLGDKFLFRIIGDGGTRCILEKAIRDSNLSNVEIIDPVSRDQLIYHYISADFLFLHLNDFEAFKKVLPSKIFEYAVFNKPIIAGVGGYAQDFIRKNLPNSIIFNPTNVDEFLNQLDLYKTCSTHQHNNNDFVELYARKNIMKQMAKSILILNNTS